MAIDDLTLNVTSICNLALTHLGMKTITDLTAGVTANNPSALALNVQWGPSRNDVFREFRWPFATVHELIYNRTDVSVSTEYPEWEFATTYPAAAVTVWNVFDEFTADNKEQNQFEILYDVSLDERIVLCNLDTQNSAYVEYTYNVTDTLLWDTKFIMAFSYRLAAAICMTLTGDEKKSLQLMQIYNAFIHETKRIAHGEKKKKPTQANPIVESRG